MTQQLTPAQQQAVDHFEGTSFTFETSPPAGQYRVWVTAIWGSNSNWLWSDSVDIYIFDLL